MTVYKHPVCCTCKADLVEKDAQDYYLCKCNGGGRTYAIERKKNYDKKIKIQISQSEALSSPW